jgi:hypothetical protein
VDRYLFLLRGGIGFNGELGKWNVVNGTNRNGPKRDDTDLARVGDNDVFSRAIPWAFGDVLCGR